MGCGISTHNLPSYMRIGRNPATRIPRQLSWRVEVNGYDADSKIAIIDQHSIGSIATDFHDNDDPSHGRKINVSPTHLKNDPELDNGDEKEHDTQNNNSNSMEINNHEDHEKEGEVVEEEYERGDNIDNLSWIGSPSFRDYCGNRHDSVDFDGKSDGEDTKTTTQRGLSHASPKPNEGSIERRKRSRFRKVFPVGKSSAMKNMLSVTTCYNPNHATSRVGQGNN